MTACFGNCSGHGICESNVCICDLDFTLSDCSASWHSPANYSIYQTYRLTMATSFGIALVVALWRTVAVSVGKHRTKRVSTSPCPSSLAADAQIQILILILLGVCGQFIANLDPRNVDRRFAPSLYRWVMLGGDTGSLLICFACARTLRMFMGIYRRFHPPTKRAIVALDAFCIVIGLLFTVSEVLVLTQNFTLGVTLVSMTFVVLVVMLVLGASAYVVGVLTAVKTMGKATTTATNLETQARQRLVRFTRGLQVVGILCAVAIGWRGLQQSPTSVALVVAPTACIAGLTILTALLLTWLMGRNPKATQPDTTVSPREIQPRVIVIVSSTTS